MPMRLYNNKDSNDSEGGNDMVNDEELMGGIFWTDEEEAEMNLPASVSSNDGMVEDGEDGVGFIESEYANDSWGNDSNGDVQAVAGSSWKDSGYESSFDEEEPSSSSKNMPNPEDVDEEEWLNQLAQISAEEVEFMEQESERANMMQQMEELGWSKEAIKDTLGLTVDESVEQEAFDNDALVQFNEEIKAGALGAVSTDDLEDLKMIESHKYVEIDEDTGEPVRAQMVYVDEHSCIGCTNCACVAQSTFFMEDDNGRARVFQQWGDDDETIQIAIETCPVDCIHYVPYDELKRLEVERRDQFINFKARLVSQGEYGGATGHRVGSAHVFTAPPEISGNMGTRCNNCPSRGCKNCPMFGVGKNPEFERREKERLQKREAKRIREEMEKREKRTDL